MWHCADQTIQSKQTVTQTHHLEDPSGSSTNNINSYLGHLHLDIFLFPAFRCCEGLLYIQVQYYILGARLLVLWSSSARTAREREPHMLIRRQPLSKLSNLFPFHLTFLISVRFIMRVAYLINLVATH